MDMFGDGIMKKFDPSQLVSNITSTENWKKYKNLSKIIVPSKRSEQDRQEILKDVSQEQPQA